MTPAANIRSIELARIDDSNRLRPVNPGVVAALVEAALAGADWGPIRVVDHGETFKLVFGAARVAAARLSGSETIVADVRSVEEYPDDASIRLDEIRENFVRSELTKLDRAVNLAAWKAIYEADVAVAKHGGKRRGAGRKIKCQTIGKAGPAAGLPVPFAQRFSLAAAAFLGISEGSVKLAVQISAGLDIDVRARIAFADIAQNQNELLLLAREAPARQHALLDLLLASPPAAHSIAEAIAVLDKSPIVRLQGWQRLASTFARLKPAEKRAFYAAHEDSIRAFIADRDRTAQAKAG